jgi:hypothetical protein
MAIGSVLSHAAPDSPVHHRTLFGAPATSADRWGSAVGALTCGASGLSGGAPDRPCRLSGAPIACALTSGAHCSALNAVADDRCARSSHCSAGTPDSPVNYSGVPSEFPEGEEFSFECPGAPGTVRCARPGCLWVVFCSLCLNPFLVFLLAYCEPLALVELID